MRYLEIIEAGKSRRARQTAEQRRRAREQIAAADKKRAGAAHKYQDELNAAGFAAAQARARLRATGVSERAMIGLEFIDAPLMEGSRSYALRDRNGVLLGWVEAVGRLLQAKDRSGTIIGWYDPRQNQTRDKTGTLVGTGDFLSALLVCRGHR